MKTPSPSHSQCTATGSLTIVSSLGVSPSLQDFEGEEEVEEEDYRKSSRALSDTGDDSDATYEDLQNHDTDTNETSLFEESQSQSESSSSDTATIDTQTYETQETYSLSSDYTGSFMNQDEFEGVDDEEEYTYDDTQDVEELTFDQTNETHDTCSTLYCSSQMDEARESSEAATLAAVSAAPVPSRKEANHFDSEPLFSIKEYRRQKRRNNGRRSSMMPRPSLSTNKDTSSKVAPIKNRAVNANVNVNANQCHVDDQQKKSKYLERIKVNKIEKIYIFEQHRVYMGKEV